MTKEEAQALFKDLMTEHKADFESAITKLKEENEELKEKLEKSDKNYKDLNENFNTHAKKANESYDKAITHILTQKTDKPEEEKVDEKTYDPYTGKWSDEDK